MIDTSQFRKGAFIELDGVPFQILEFQHVKPGKGNAFVRTKLKNLILGTVLDKTFKSGEKFEEPDLQRKWVQYLYHDSNGYHMLDTENSEELQVDEKVLGENVLYLTENLELDVIIYKGKTVSIELPNFVNLFVEYTEPAVKGDTVSGGGKPARMTTGLTISVPFHIRQGDCIKIDTRTGQYVEKVK